jgi:putative flippase GtrA
MSKERTAIRKHGGQLARFSGVGVLCTLTDFALFAAFVALGAAAVPANIASFLVANVIGYVLNGRVTFRGGEGLSIKGYAKFFGAYSASLVLSTLVVAAFAASLGPILAKIIAAAVAAVWNYVFSALVVFKSAAEADDASPKPL